MTTDHRIQVFQFPPEGSGSGGAESTYEQAIAGSNANTRMSPRRVRNALEDMPFVATSAITPRILPERFAVIREPEDFGAVGDGVANDASALEAASTAAGVGGVIRFRPGATYLISTTFQPNHINQIFHGNGATLKANTNLAGSTSVFWCIAGTRLFDLIVDGNGVNQGGVGNVSGINFGTVDNCMIEGCRIVNTKTGGILGHNASHTKVRNNTIICADGDGHVSAWIGIFMQDSAGLAGEEDNEISGNLVDATGMGLTETGDGILIGGHASVPAKNYVVERNRVYLPYSPNTTGQVLIELRNMIGGSFTGNSGRGGRIGWSYANTSDLPCLGGSLKGVLNYAVEIADGSMNLAVSGVSIDGTDDAGTAVGDWGIAVQGAGCDHIALDGNTIRDVVSDGIRFSNVGHTRCMVSDNVIELASGATGYGINAACDDFSVVGNSLEGDTATALNGIYVQASSRVSIYGNRVRNFNDAAIRVESGAGTETDIDVEGNTQTGCANLIDWTTLSGGSFGARVRRRSGSLAQRPTGLGTDDVGFKYFDTTLSSTVEWTGTAWRALGIIVLGRSGATGLSYTGDTTETTLASIAVPANSMGTKGTLVITAHWTLTNNANLKTTRYKYGATTHYASTNASFASTRHQIHIQNRDSASAQVSQAGSATSGGWIGSTATVTTGAVDSTSAQNVVISVQLATGTDTATLDWYRVELIPG